MVVTVNKVYEGTPSESAGLLKDDVIVSVDGTEAASMELSELVKLIRGEKGTTVHLEIYRPSTEENLSFDVERQDITLPSVPTGRISSRIWSTAVFRSYPDGAYHWHAPPDDDTIRHSLYSIPSQADC